METSNIESELSLWKMRAEERQQEIERLRVVLAEERHTAYKLALRIIEIQDERLGPTSTAKGS